MVSFFDRFKLTAKVITLLFLFSSSVFSSGEGKKTSGKETTPDTSKVKINVNKKSQANSLIQFMSKEQLGSLIDFLFEMDSIPADMIEELNAVIESKENSNGQTCEGFPATDYYDEWDNKNIFTIKQLNSKIENTFLLDLIGENIGGFCSPISGLVTSNFGWRDSAQHNGIDIDLNRGDPVFAAFDGMVRVAKFHGGFGNVVVIRHTNGLETIYAHLSKLKVKPNQYIKSGEIVGLGGATGHARGTHLHFELRFKGVPVNPKYVISFTEQKLYYDQLVFKRTSYGWAAYPPNASEYTAEKGDTLLSVARRFGIPLDKLSKINSLSYWTRLKPGQKVVLS